MAVAVGGMEQPGKKSNRFSNDRLNSHAAFGQLLAFYQEVFRLPSNEEHNSQY